MSESAIPAAPAAGKSFPPEAEAAIRDSLKRCSSATIEAAVGYRRDGDPNHLPAIIIGIVERFVEPDLRSRLGSGDDDLRFVEDLGIDSLTMMEIVILVEEVVQLQIPNDDLRNLRTLSDVKTYIDCRARGLPPPTPSKFFAIEDLVALMPVQPPFLFLNEASVGTASASGKYKITGQEFFLQGHFKDNPVMPASIMLEALGQLGVLHLLAGHVVAEPGKVVGPGTIYFTGCEGVRAHRVCRPGDVLTISIKPKRMKLPLATFEGSVRVGQEKAVIAEEITLTYGYVEAALPAPTVAPAPNAVPAPADAGTNGSHGHKVNGSAHEPSAAERLKAIGS